MPNLVVAGAAATPSSPAKTGPGAPFRRARALAREVQPVELGAARRCPMPVLASSGVVASMTVWIERADGTILRGSAETVSPRSARVRLPGRPAFSPDEPVVLRICFAPERPTVAAAALVRWTRPLGEAVECGLDWDLGTVEFGFCPTHLGA